MAANRAASRAVPFLARGAGPRAMRMRSTALPRQVSAIALLVPRRPLSTETSTSSGSPGNFPPPGFNAEEAKKSLPKESHAQPEADKPAATSKEAEAAPSFSKEDVRIPRDKATSHPKTKAAEANSLTELVAEKAAADKATGKEVEKKKEEHKKLTIWQKVKKEAAHYWDGTKLLATEVKISSKLALRMAAGYELTRREHRQVRHHMTFGIGSRD